MIWERSPLNGPSTKLVVLQASTGTEGLLGENAPLLREAPSEDIGGMEGSCGEMAEMEEGRPLNGSGGDSGGPSQQHSIQELLWTAPGEAVHWLENQGCVKLGSFRVQARPPPCLNSLAAGRKGKLLSPR